MTSTDTGTVVLVPKLAPKMSTSTKSVSTTPDVM